MIKCSLESVATCENGKYNYFKLEKQLEEIFIGCRNEPQGVREDPLGLKKSLQLEFKNEFLNMNIAMFDVMLVTMTYTQYPSIHICFKSHSYDFDYRELNRSSLLSKYKKDSFEVLTRAGKYDFEIKYDGTAKTTSNYINIMDKKDKNRNYSICEVIVIRDKRRKKIACLDIRLYLDKDEFKTIDSLKEEIKKYMSSEQIENLTWVDFKN